MTSKYLIVAPSWVGDMVMAHSLFRLIKQLQPSASIDVMGPKHCHALLDAMPEVENIILSPFGHGQFAFSERKALGKSLSDRGYTHSMVLPNSWKSALVPYFARIPTRIGFKGEWRHFLLNDCRRLDKKALPLMIQRFCALAIGAKETLPDALPKPRFQMREDVVQAVVDKFSINLSTPVLALCPGAEFGPAKKWPESHYAEVARAYHDKGYQVWLLGAKSDQETTSAIASEATCQDFAGQTSLEEAMALISLATKVVTNDSGLMHIAAALDRPLVAVYGSTSPLFTPPLSNTAKILNIELDCRPCFKRHCPLTGDQHLKCLNDLSPSSVVAALDEL